MGQKLVVSEPGKWSRSKRVYYKFLRKFIQNPKRKRISSKVHKLSPSPQADLSNSFSVHTLTCKRDLEMGIWSAKSFNLVCGNAFEWVFHEDGSLDDRDCQLLEKHFPGCKVIRYADSIEHAKKEFSNHKNILKYREKLKLMLKLLDISKWSKGQRILFIDTDVLFFKKPDLLLDLVNDENGKNMFNKDVDYAYIFSIDTLEKVMSKKLPEKINSGLFVIDKDIFDFDKIEKWFEELPMDEPFIIHRLEQSLIAMSAADSEIGVEHLPDEYDVQYHKDVSQSICKHYVGRIRHGFEIEGLQYLLNSTDFISKWEEFAKN